MFLSSPIWAISGDLADFPGKVDQRTVRQYKCRETANLIKLTFRIRWSVKDQQIADVGKMIKFYKNYQLFFGN